MKSVRVRKPSIVSRLSNEDFWSLIRTSSIVTSSKMRQLKDVVSARPDYEEQSRDIWETYTFTKFNEQVNFIESILNEMHILDVIAFQKYMNVARDETRNWEFWSGFCLMAEKPTISRLDGLSGFVISAGYEYFEKLKNNPSRIVRNIPVFPMQIFQKYSL